MMVDEEALTRAINTVIASIGRLSQFTAAMASLKALVVRRRPKSGYGVDMGWGKMLLPAAQRVGLALAALEPVRFLPLLEVLAIDNSPQIRAFACRVLGEVGKHYPHAVVPLLKRLAADPNWEVREHLANALDEQMSSVQGDFVYDLMRTWAHDPNEWVRRVPTNALMRYGRQHPEKVIALMRELLHDDSRAVRENVCFCLGVIGAERVIALGGAADPQRPRLLLATLREWLSDEDERARWIIAKTLGRSWVKPVLPDALKLLKVLAADPRPRVRAAVVSTIRSLHRYEPDRVATSLVAWRRARNTHIRTVAIQLDVQGYHAP